MSSTETLFLIKSDKLSINCKLVSAIKLDSCVVLLGQEKDFSSEVGSLSKNDLANNDDDDDEIFVVI